MCRNGGMDKPEEGETHMQVKARVIQIRIVCQHEVGDSKVVPQFDVKAWKEFTSRTNIRGAFRLEGGADEKAVALLNQIIDLIQVRYPTTDGIDLMVDEATRTITDVIRDQPT